MNKLEPVDLQFGSIDGSKSKLFQILNFSIDGASFAESPVESSKFSSFPSGFQRQNGHIIAQ